MESTKTVVLILFVLIDTLKNHSIQTFSSNEMFQPDNSQPDGLQTQSSVVSGKQSRCVIFIL